MTRAVVAGWSLAYLGKRWRLLGEVAGGRRRDFHPVGVVRVLRRPLPVRVVQAGVVATYVASAAVTVGWRHRLTGPVWGALLLWTVTYRNSWSMVFHNDNILVLHALVLGCAPGAADVLAVDARRETAPDGAHWRYGWPLQLMSAVTALTYLLAGIAKVVGPLGWRWASGTALRSQVEADAVRKDLLGSGSSPVVAALHGREALWRTMAVGSLVLELGAPVALVSRRLGRAWAVAAWSLHVGILAVMRIRFRYQLSGVAYASFLDLERVVGRRWRA
jgi:hypothetical protein